MRFLHALRYSFLVWSLSVITGSLALCLMSTDRYDPFSDFPGEFGLCLFVSAIFSLPAFQVLLWVTWWVNPMIRQPVFQIKAMLTIVSATLSVLTVAGVGHSLNGFNLEVLGVTLPWIISALVFALLVRFNPSSSRPSTPAVKKYESGPGDSSLKK